MAHQQQQPGVGKWTREEHQRYLQAIKIYPQGPWQSVANYVGTRSARQTQTHAQKYREKVSRRKRGLLRKRAMSDEWLENQSSSSDEIKYTTSQVTSLPALTVKTETTYTTTPSTKSFNDLLPPRLPTLEPLHLQGGSYNIGANDMDKSFPPGGFQASMMYNTPTTHHQYPPQHPPPYSCHYSIQPPPSHHSTNYHPAPYRESTPPQRTAPPLEELLQFFADDVELMGHHRDRPIFTLMEHIVLHEREELKEQVIDLLQTQWPIHHDTRRRGMESNPDHDRVVLLVTDRVIGHALVKWEEPTVAFVVSVVVHQEWRRQGIGAKLMDAVECVARRRTSSCTLYLWTADQDRFFHSLGFAYCEPYHARGKAAHTLPVNQQLHLARMLQARLQPKATSPQNSLSSADTHESSACMWMKKELNQS